MVDLFTSNKNRDYWCMYPQSRKIKPGQKTDYYPPMFIIAKVKGRKMPDPSEGSTIASLVVIFPTARNSVDNPLKLPPSYNQLKQTNYGFTQSYVKLHAWKLNEQSPNKAFS